MHRILFVNQFLLLITSFLLDEIFLVFYYQFWSLKTKQWSFGSRCSDIKSVYWLLNLDVPTWVYISGGSLVAGRWDFQLPVTNCLPLLSP